jgi:quercetin dioxygenase-like cupin family protein
MDRRHLLAFAPLLALAQTNRQPPFWLTQVQPESDIFPQQLPWGTLRVYHEGPTDQLAYMNAGTVVLKPGQEPHPPHQHPEEEFLIVTKGSGEMFIDGKTTKIKTGALMFTKAQSEHGIKNTGKTALEFFYCKWRTS